MSNDNAPLKVIGYGRKSVAEDGSVSLSAQESEVRKWCEARGYELVCFYGDDGVSGKSLDRPEFNKALKHLHSLKSPKALVSYSLSRLSRSTSDALKLGKMLDSRGIALVSVSEQIDRSTPHGQFQYELLCSLNALEREIGRARTKTAMRELRKQNRRISRFAPYGWDFAGEATVPNQSEQSIIGQMVKMRNGGATLGQIVKWLEDTKTPTKNGGKWARMTVSLILKRAG